MFDPRAALPHRPDIQGLRAIAVLLVVLAHAGVSGFSGGIIGVDVFFVLSGYLITGLLVQEHKLTGRITLVSFYARRLRRLLPALALVVLTVVGVAALLLSTTEARNQLASAAYAATWASNLYFAFTTVDYFAEAQSRDLFLHTWSLGVEEQFYLIWPIVLILVLRGSTNTSRVLIAVASLLAASFALQLYWSSVQPLWAFYLMPSRIWQFAVGALVFLLCNTVKTSRSQLEPGSSKILPLAGLAGIGLVIGSACLLGENARGAWLVAPTLGAALLLIAAGTLDPTTRIQRLLSHGLFVWIGDRSYSLYLWHWPVLMLAAAYGLGGSPLETICLVAAALLLADATYRCIEKPFWKGRLSQSASSPAVILCAASAMLLLLVGPVRIPDLLPADPVSPDAVAARHTDGPEIYRMGCDGFTHTVAIKPCAFGPVDAKHTAVLIGDSIGAQWTSLVTDIYSPPDWRTIILTKSACPMVDQDIYYDRIGAVFTVCREWRERALEYVSKLQPDIVFIGSAATYDFSRDDWIDGSTRILDRLAAATTNVVVIAGTPRLPFSGPECLVRRSQKKLRIGTQRTESCSAPVEDQVAAVSAYLQEAVRQVPSARLLNLNDAVCPDKQCSAMSPDGMVVFRDSQHLNNRFVRSKVPAAHSRLDSLGLAAQLTSPACRKCKS